MEPDCALLHRLLAAEDESTQIHILLDAFECFFEQNRLKLCLHFVRGIHKNLKSKDKIAMSPIDQGRFEPKIVNVTV